MRAKTEPIRFDADIKRYQRQIVWGVGVLVLAAISHFFLPSSGLVKGFDWLTEAAAVVCLVGGLVEIVTGIVSIFTNLTVGEEMIQMRSPLCNWKTYWIAVDLVELIRPKKETKDGYSYLTVRLWKEKKPAGEIDLTVFSVANASALVGILISHALGLGISVKKI